MYVKHFFYYTSKDTIYKLDGVFGSRDSIYPASPGSCCTELNLPMIMHKEIVEERKDGLYFTYYYPNKDTIITFRRYPLKIKDTIKFDGFGKYFYLAARVLIVKNRILRCIINEDEITTNEWQHRSGWLE